MKLNYYQILTYIVFISFSCDDPNSPSDVWDPNDVGESSPFISNIEPPDRAYAGHRKSLFMEGISVTIKILHSSISILALQK